MKIEILGRNAAGTCDLTRKEKVEVWAVRAQGGDITHVCTQRLPEVLRVLASIGETAPSVSAVDTREKVAAAK